MNSRRAYIVTLSDGRAVILAVATAADAARLAARLYPNHLVVRVR